MKSNYLSLTVTVDTAYLLLKLIHSLHNDEII